MTEAAPTWFRNAIAHTPSERTIDVQGCPIHTLSWGNPKLPGLLLVHGGAAHAHWWSFLAPLLSQRYYVVAPEELSPEVHQLGHGSRAGEHELAELEHAAGLP